MDEVVLDRALPWTSSLKHELELVAKTIRQLSIDAIEKANSGHPGLPLGCAELGAYLYGYLLQHNPKEPKWFNRDRFILSAGHGSMLLYSCLYLAGFPLTLEDIKQFRQLESKTPGHPESLDTEGVETTTGPLGQGLAVACGQALGLKLLAEKFNTKEISICTGKVYCLAGDGCIMEGITSEASSLAGHLCLDNLVVIYDSNQISLDGPLSQSCSEDTLARYRAYGWEVFEVDGHDLEAIHATFRTIGLCQNKPCLVVAHTIIGKGSPHLSGTNKAHGSPLGPEEAKLTKEALGLSQEPFAVDENVLSFFAKRREEQEVRYTAWKELFAKWKQHNPQLAETFSVMQTKTEPKDLEKQLQELSIKDPEATRNSSHVVLQKLAEVLPFLYGGSADLSGSDKTLLKEFPLVGPSDFKGRNIKYGVREFAMGAMATGLVQTGMILPFIGTFLTFSDYMRNAIRLACLQKAHVVYQFTHDSIFLGEDGPTHQPVEHLAALRAMPNLHVIRPADAHEMRSAWLAALEYEGPTALILARQNVPALQETNCSYAEGVRKGGYVLVEKQNALVTLLATGSEVCLAMETRECLEKEGIATRVVSLPCFELFAKQSKEYQASVLGNVFRVSLEAATTFGWCKWVGDNGLSVGIDTFGLSAKAKDLAKHFGFTPEAIVAKIQKSLA